PVKKFQTGYTNPGIAQPSSRKIKLSKNSSIPPWRDFHCLKRNQSCFRLSSCCRYLMRILWHSRPLLCGLQFLWFCFTQTVSLLPRSPACSGFVLDHPIGQFPSSLSNYQFFGNSGDIGNSVTPPPLPYHPSHPNLAWVCPMPLWNGSHSS